MRYTASLSENTLYLSCTNWEVFVDITTRAVAHPLIGQTTSHNQGAVSFVSQKRPATLLNDLLGFLLNPQSGRVGQRLASLLTDSPLCLRACRENTELLLFHGGQSIGCNENHSWSFLENNFQNYQPVGWYTQDVLQNAVSLWQKGLSSVGGGLPRRLHTLMSLGQNNRYGLGAFSGGHFLYDLDRSPNYLNPWGAKIPLDLPITPVDQALRHFGAARFLGQNPPSMKHRIDFHGLSFTIERGVIACTEEGNPPVNFYLTEAYLCLVSFLDAFQISLLDQGRVAPIDKTLYSSDFGSVTVSEGRILFQDQQGRPVQAPTLQTLKSHRWSRIQPANPTTTPRPVAGRSTSDWWIADNPQSKEKPKQEIQHFFGEELKSPAHRQIVLAEGVVGLSNFPCKNLRLDTNISLSSLGPKVLTKTDGLSRLCCLNTSQITTNKGWLEKNNMVPVAMFRNLSTWAQRTKTIRQLVLFVSLGTESFPFSPKGWLTTEALSCCGITCINQNAINFMTELSKRLDCYKVAIVSGDMRETKIPNTEMWEILPNIWFVHKTSAETNGLNRLDIQVFDGESVRVFGNRDDHDVHYQQNEDEDDEDEDEDEYRDDDDD